MRQKHHKGGRPTKMTPSTLGKLREAFLLGASDAEACLVAKIHPDTLYAYQKQHPEFSEGKAACKLNPVLKARRAVFNDLDNPRTAMWYLERRAKGEFGEAASEQVKTCDCPKTFVEWYHGLREVRKNGQVSYEPREGAHSYANVG